MDAVTEVSASASSSSSAAAPAVVFKRKRGPASRSTSSSTADVVAASSSTSASTGSNQTGPSRVSRDRSGSESSGSDNERSAVVVKKKRSNHNPLVQSTGSVYRKSKLGSSHNSDDEYPLESEPSSRDALSTTTGSSTASSLAKIREDATKHSDWDLDNPPNTASSSLNQPLTNSDGLYRGAKSYASFTPTRDDGTSSKIRARGPIRSTTTVRTTSLMDYQPDVCKDYKETGYCGFGDTCKFLHDRSDYLAGWQLDVLPNSTSRARDNILSDPEDAPEEQVPFACLICRQPFTDPIVTRCGHYFCSACAIKRFSRNTKCFACGKQTGGLFNSAKKVLDRMQAANRVKEDARREKHAWLDDEPSIRDSGADQDSDDE